MSNHKRDNDAQVFSYMDGIPVKISEKYKRPRKIVLPMGYQNRFQRESAVSIEYDFHLEKSVKNKIDEWKEAREKEIAARKERILAEDEAAAYVSPSSASATGYVSSETSDVNPALTPPSKVITTSCSSILTPVPISKPCVQGNQVKTTLSNLNLSDFEDDTSSPFDTVELKTLNDMEELAYVLQSEAVSNNSNTEQYLPQNSYNTETVCHPSHCDENSDSQVPIKSIIPQVNGLTGSYALMEYRAGKSNINKINNFSYLHDNLNNPSYDFHTPQTQQSSSTHFSTQQFHPSYVSSAIPESMGQVEQQPPLSGQTLSKSVPDIIRELEKELSNQRITQASSKTPPPHSTSFNSTGLEDWKPWPVLDSPERTVPQQPESRLHNPFSELSTSDQRHALYISNEMGFSLPKVARACQMFGDNKKLVIEFLLQVQSLEEKGYSSDRAECALVSNGYNISKAAKHLEALHQLLDFGFPENKIIETLLKCDNDRDKALDILVS